RRDRTCRVRRSAFGVLVLRFFRFLVLSSGLNFSLLTFHDSFGALASAGTLTTAGRGALTLRWASAAGPHTARRTAVDVAVRSVAGELMTAGALTAALMPRTEPVRPAPRLTDRELRNRPC